MTYKRYLSKEARKEIRKERLKATAKKALEKIGIGLYCTKTVLSTFLGCALLFAFLFLLPAFFH